MATVFDTFFAVARSSGLFEFYLPFLLVLTLFYGLLEKTKLLGEKSARFNIIIAAVAALYVMVYSPIAITLTTFFSTFFTETSIVLVTLLVGLLILGLLGGPILGTEGWKQFGQKWMGVALFAAVLIGVALFWTSGGFALFGQIIPEIGLSSGDLMLIALLLITIGVMWYITQGGKD